MSFRSVEMQIAIPRTSEIGQVQNHLMQKPTYDQTALAAKMTQRKERQLRQSTNVEGSDAPHIRDEREAGTGGKGRGKATKKAGMAKERDDSAAGPAHPYKGRHIDITI
ncbi:hypothetical protein ACFFNY_24440 [Paenibacillus hodogayensis]|uniref:Uncharacterized protein n=1 Tax=Paenibacillus hodogayensis TaxID=279208 RepID=A0ABV5W2T9_9BACL